MARQFDTAVTGESYEYADHAAIKSGAGSFSVFLRLYIDAINGGVNYVFNKGNSSGAPHGGIRYEFVFTSAKIDFTIDDNTTKSSASWVTTPTTGAWLNFVCVRDAGNDVFIYEDAIQRASKIDGTGDIDTSATLVLAAGRNVGSTLVGFSDARIADWAYLERIATAGEIKAFNKGYDQPADCSAYIPLIRETHEIYASIALSGTTGTPAVVPHPRVIRRPGQILQFPPAAAGGETITIGEASLAFAAQALQMSEEIPVAETNVGFAGQPLQMSEEIPVAETNVGFAGQGLLLLEDTTIIISESTLPITPQELLADETVNFVPTALSLSAQAVNISESLQIEEGSISFTGRALTLSGVVEEYRRAYRRLGSLVGDMLHGR